jgi:hypothetical protein
MWLSSIPILPWACAFFAIAIGCMVTAGLDKPCRWKEACIIVAIAAVPVGIAIFYTIHAHGCMSCQVAASL